MSLNKKSIDDINVKGLRVLCRCDFNVPLKEGKITDENRLVAALPTIKKLIADGGKVILCSHLGKVKTEEDKQTKTLAPVAARLTELLGQEVKFVVDPEVVGENVRAAVAAMNDGDVILLENTRFRPEETKNGEAFSKDLASICVKMRHFCRTFSKKASQTAFILISPTHGQRTAMPKED